MTRQRVMLAGIVLVAMTGLWYLLLWSPQSKNLSKARVRRDAAIQQTEQLQTQLQRLRSAQQNQAAKLAQLEKLTAAIPDQANLAQFILDTNTAATQAGVAFLSITPTPPASPAGAAGGAAAGTAGAAGTGSATGTASAPRPAEIRLAMNVTGGYFQVLDFMNRIDQLPRLVVIDQLSVAPQPGAGGSTQLNVTLTGRMFVSPSAVPSAAGSASSSGVTTTTTTAPGATATTSTTR